MTETPDMGYDVLALARSLQPQIMSNNSNGYSALERLAPMLSCWQFGHPNQPDWFLGRFKDRPWRCERCGTWWRTEHYSDYGNYDSGGAWRWTRIEVDE